MRAGASTIQQTLTPEAGAVLNQSISDAARRNHGQTTPLHVAATLLSSSTGLLRQACVKSHPNSSHPLQCRALELCFSVALERLPAAQGASGGGEPPISNALMAALKRAAAQQRRGCPEQQQQPLLAVKVELHHLIISILDDPSVSRVMKEASFSSPAVKASIEQSHPVKPLPTSFIPNSSFSFRPVSPLPVPIPVVKNMYVNPKLQASSPGAISLTKRTGEDVKKVNDIMLRRKKKNPILVGETEAEQVVNEVLQCKEGMKIVDLEKDVADKSTIGELVESLIRDLGNLKGIVVNLGNLNWLVQQNSCFVAPCTGNGAGGVVTEAGKAVVAAVGKVVGERANVWLIGTATCETFLRCQVYHPSMEGDWDLQAVPIAAKSKLPIRLESPLPPSRFSITNNVAGGANLKSKKANLPEWLKVAASRETLTTSNPEKDAPVTTDLDLALGCPKVGGDNDGTKDFIGLDRSLKLLEASKNKLANSFDVEFVKKLLKGLMEAVSWQQDAATAVASAITKCKLGDGKRNRGDIWLLFSGPDKIGKWKMVNTISDLMSGVSPTVVSFNTRNQKEFERGKTALDRIVDAVRKNPFSLIILEDIDDGDFILKNAIKRAIERGRISDSHGREYTLGNCIFIFTASWLPEETSKEEAKSLGDWHLRVSLSERSAKRHARWLLADRPIKQKKDSRSGLLFDLNEAAHVEDCSRAEESSDLTSECEDEHTIVINKAVPPKFLREIVNYVEDNIVFKLVDSDNVRREIVTSIKKKFSSTMGDAITVEIQEEAINRIECGVRLGWFEYEEWSDRVLQPVISRLGLRIPSDANSFVVRIETDNDSLSLHHEAPWGPGSWEYR